MIHRRMCGLGKPERPYTFIYQKYANHWENWSRFLELLSGVSFISVRHITLTCWRQSCLSPTPQICVCPIAGERSGETGGRTVGASLSAITGSRWKGAAAAGFSLTWHRRRTMKYSYYMGARRENRGKINKKRDWTGGERSLGWDEGGFFFFFFFFFHFFFSCRLSYSGLALACLMLGSPYQSIGSRLRFFLVLMGIFFNFDTGLYWVYMPLCSMEGGYLYWQAPLLYNHQAGMPV